MTSGITILLFCGLLIWISTPAVPLYPEESLDLQTWQTSPETSWAQAQVAWQQGQFQPHSGLSFQFPAGQVTWVALRLNAPLAESLWITWGNLPLSVAHYAPQSEAIGSEPAPRQTLLLHARLIPQPSEAPLHFFRVESDSWLTTEVQVLNGYEYQTWVLQEQLKLYPVLGALLLLSLLLVLSHVKLSGRLPFSAQQQVQDSLFLAAFCLALAALLLGYYGIVPLQKNFHATWTLGWGTLCSLFVFRIQANAAALPTRAPGFVRFHRRVAGVVVGLSLIWGVWQPPGWQNVLLLQVVLTLLPPLSFHALAWFRRQPHSQAVLFGLGLLLISTLLLQLESIFDLEGAFAAYQNLFFATVVLNCLLLVALYVDWRNTLLETWIQEDLRLQEAQALDQRFRSKLAQPLSPGLSRLMQVTCSQLRWFQETVPAARSSGEWAQVEALMKKIQHTIQALELLRAAPFSLHMNLQALVTEVTRPLSEQLRIGQTLEVPLLPEVHVQVAPQGLQLVLELLLKQAFRKVPYGTVTLQATPEAGAVQITLQVPVSPLHAPLEGAPFLEQEVNLDTLLLEALLEQQHLLLHEEFGPNGLLQRFSLPLSSPSPATSMAAPEAGPVFQVLCREALWFLLSPYRSASGRWNRLSAPEALEVAPSSIFLLEEGLVPPDVLERLREAAAPVLLLTEQEPSCSRFPFRVVKLPEEGPRLEGLLRQAQQMLSQQQAPQPQRIDERALLVELMQQALRIWHEATGKEKTDLASESRIWKVQVEYETQTQRTRALDRYLNLETLPQNPRWRSAFNTIEYVLHECSNHPAVPQVQARFRQLTQRIP